MLLAPGQEIDRYRVIQRIGEGGSSSVYQVEDLETGASRALKLMSVSHEATRHRMLVEGRVQADLASPHLVKVFDILDVAGFVGLVMELVEGPSLRVLVERAPLSVDDALCVLTGITQGVTVAHAAGVVHRDIKPSNVLLRLDDEWIVPALCDFGIAKVLAEGHTSGPTHTGATLGTPSFMAPEQLHDASRVGFEADVWSLGCLLYAMVTGVNAFKGESMLTTLTSVSTGNYQPASAHQPGLPAAIDDIIDACLQVEPARRVGTPNELLALVSKAFGTRPGRLGQDSALANQLRQLRIQRRKTPWQAPAGVKVVMPEFRTTAETGALATLTDADDEPPASRSPTWPWLAAAAGAGVGVAVVAAVVVLQLVSDPPAAPVATASPPVAPAPTPAPPATKATAADPIAPARPRTEPARSTAPALTPARAPSHPSPPPPVPAMSRVALSGDAAIVQLVAPDGQVHDIPSSVPAQSYLVRARFGEPDAELREFGPFAFPPDVHQVVKCTSGWEHCRVIAAPAVDGAGDRDVD